MSEALQAPAVIAGGFSIGSLGWDKAHFFKRQGLVNCLLSGGDTHQKENPPEGG
jgi:hypothetical protein